MMNILAARSRWVMIVLFVAASAIALARHEVLATPDQPDEYYFESQSGRYELEVRGIREDKQHDHPTRLTMRRDGLVVWTRQVEGSIRDAAVTDSGVVIGAVYFWKPVVGSRYRLEMLETILLNVRGETTMRFTMERDEPIVPHASREPMIGGVRLFGDQEQALVILSRSGNIASSSWLLIDLATGAHQRIDGPGLDGRPRGWSAQENRVLELWGMPYVVVNWCLENTRGDWAKDAVVAIHDSDGRIVWSDRYDSEYEVGDSRALFRWEMELPRLRLNQLERIPHGFQFHSRVRNEIIEYRVDLSDHGLDVRQVGVTPALYVVPEDE